MHSTLFVKSIIENSGNVALWLTVRLKKQGEIDRRCRDILLGYISRQGVILDVFF